MKKEGLDALLKTLLEEFRETIHDPVFPRPFSLLEFPKKASVVMGMRR